MPTYEYRCAQGHTFEQFQRMSEPPVDKCPVCGAPAERQLSAGAILFKGSGFYITDYRSDKYKKAAAEDGGTPAPDKKTDSDKKTGSDKKPEGGDMGASAAAKSSSGSSEGNKGGGAKDTSASE